MNIVDAVLAAVLCVFAARGYVKGLFREVFALLGLSVGVIVSLRYCTQIAALWVESWPYSPLILQGLVFVALFFLVYIACNWMGFMLHRWANRLFLVGFDRLGGVLLGGAKAAVILGLGLYAATTLSWVPSNFQHKFDEAVFVGPLSHVGETVAVLGSAVPWRGVPPPDSPDSPDSKPGLEPDPGPGLEPDSTESESKRGA